MLSKKNKKKKQLQSTEHICVMLAGSEEKETNLAGYLSFEGHDISDSGSNSGPPRYFWEQTQKCEADKNQSAKVRPGSLREVLSMSINKKL